jgi:glycosyltransferase involved in cell wall biosynthesis
MISATHGGGFQTYNNNMLKQLFINPDDNEYYIFTNDKLLCSPNNKINIIFISNIYSKTIFRLLWMQVILPINLFLMKIDILFSPMNIMPIILKLSKIKNVLVIHSNLPWLFPDDVPGNRLKLFLQLFFTNISIKISDKIIVDSLTAKTELCCIFKNINNKTTSVYLGIDHNSFIGDMEIDIIDNRINIINDSYFLTIASAVRYHCLIELIDAYELL